MDMGQSTFDQDDDFYGNQDDNHVAESERQQREIEALRRQHFATGVREGAGSARDKTLQSGFDRGFNAGAKAAAEAGFLLGVSSLLDEFHTKYKSKRYASTPHKVELDTRAEADLISARDDGRRFRSTLQNFPVDSTIDVRSCRKACERLIPFIVPNFFDSQASRATAGERKER